MTVVFACQEMNGKVDAEYSSECEMLSSHYERKKTVSTNRGQETVSPLSSCCRLKHETADWKRRGVGHSYQEALLKEVLQLQTRALLKPISLPAEEVS